MQRLSNTFMRPYARNSGQFESACIKWKALPSADKKTNKQCRAFFGKKYNVYHTSQNSLGLAGVANSAQQVQELEQVTHNGFRAIGERQNAQSAVNTRQEEINASVMQMIAAIGTVCVSTSLAKQMLFHNPMNKKVVGGNTMF